MGIEDLFSKTDFAKILIKNTKTKITNENSEFMKDEKISKVITARDFMIGVNDGKINLTDFSTTTKDSIDKLLTKIIGTLKHQPTPPVV